MLLSRSNQQQHYRYLNIRVIRKQQQQLKHNQHPLSYSLSCNSCYHKHITTHLNHQYNHQHRYDVEQHSCSQIHTSATHNLPAASAAATMAVRRARASAAAVSSSLSSASVSRSREEENDYYHHGRTSNNYRNNSQHNGGMKMNNRSHGSRNGNSVGRNSDDGVNRDLKNMLLQSVLIDMQNVAANSSINSNNKNGALNESKNGKSSLRSMTRLPSFRKPLPGSMLLPETIFKASTSPAYTSLREVEGVVRSATEKYNLLMGATDEIMSASKPSTPESKQESLRGLNALLHQQLLKHQQHYAPSPDSKALLEALRTAPIRQRESLDKRRERQHRISQRYRQSNRRSQMQNIFASQSQQDMALRINGETAESQRAQEVASVKDEKRKRVHIYARQTVAHLSNTMKVSAQALLIDLRALGSRATSSQDYIDADAAELLLQKHGFEGVRQLSALESAKQKLQGIDYQSLPRRSPVACVAGHVDHGKTTLLDALRSSKLAAKEAGGITQTIGAFTVDMQSNLDEDEQDESIGSDRKVSAIQPNDATDDIHATPRYATFLDTPGHAAFKNLRARGISSACVDMMVLVVSAVDGIQPQTIEAIRLATSNSVPIVVAINKCDLYGADPDKIQVDLLKYDVVTEKHGGDVQCVPISALKRTNLDQLREAVSLTAEMSDLRASRAVPAQCYVVEAKIDRQHGVILNVVVRNGTIRVGDWVVSGTQYGKVRVMINEHQQRPQMALPSQGVQLVGMSTLEGTDSELIVVADEAEAEKIVNERVEANQVQRAAEHEEADGDATGMTSGRYTARRNSRRLVAVKPLSEEEKAAQELAEKRNLNLIIKCDVQGALEAFLTYISQLSACSTEVTVTILRTGIGEVSEADVVLASETNALVLGYGIDVNAKIDSLSRNLNVQVMCNPIIYNLMDEICSQLSSRMPPFIEKRVAATADVLQVFDLNAKRGTKVNAAGCRISNGDLNVKHTIRVRRGEDDTVVYDEGVIQSLKHFKEEVKEVKKGDECGLVVRGFNDWKHGDMIECVDTVVTPRRFDDSFARGEVPDKSNVQEFSSAYKSQLANA